MSCTVFDATGRQVARLVDAVRAAGRHTVAWDAAGAAPGVYFLEVVSGGTASAARLVKAR